MDLPTYTDAAIRQHGLGRFFPAWPGVSSQWAVESLIQRGMTLQAEVWGSELYRVQVTFSPTGSLGATCTCPYDWGGWCKHIVAALLAAREQPEMVKQRRPVGDLLAGLHRDQLQALLLELTQIEPEWSS